MVFRPTISIVLLSFILGILILLLFSLSTQTSSGETYGVLSVDEAFQDRAIGELLRTGGFNEYYSESTTRIYIDDFGKPKGFFLDQFLDEFEPFDPRNNGYAEKLRSFFVHDGRRYFYIPLEYTILGEQIGIKNIGYALGNVPFSLEILGPSRPLLILFFFQFSAVIFVMVISSDKTRFGLQIPIILAFAWEGIPGLILTGILTGLWELMREPLGEIFNPEPYGSLEERLRPYQYFFFWVIFFLMLFFVVSLICNVALLPVFSGFFCFFLLEYLSFAKKRKESWKPRFIPVLILPKPKKLNPFRFSVLVFASASLLVLVLFLFFPGLSTQFSGRYPVDFINYPIVSEYEEYMAFQSSFSLVPLHTQIGDNIQNGYFHYFLGEDGLIAGTGESLSAWEIPAFPLEKLSGFLLNYMNKTLDTPHNEFKEWIIVSLVLICCIPNTRVMKKNRVNKYKIPLLKRSSNLRDPRISEIFGSQRFAVYRLRDRKL